MLHPRSELQIFAALDSLCDMVRGSQLYHFTVVTLFWIKSTLFKILAFVDKLTGELFQATKKLGDHYTVPCKR